MGVPVVLLLFLAAAVAGREPEPTQVRNRAPWRCCALILTRVEAQAAHACAESVRN